VKHLLANIQRLITAVLLLLIGGFLGYNLGVNGYDVHLKKSLKPVEITNKTPKIETSVDFDRFWTVWDQVSTGHIARPFDSNTLVDGAIKGMVESIGDPYSVYLTKEENSATHDSLNGKYQGIGAQLGFDENERLMIVTPLDGSPAEKAGVRAGDLIIAIEGKDTTGYSIQKAVGLIRGEAGTVSHLTLYRKDVDKPIEVSITRETIVLPSVKWEDKGDGIVYIRLSRFGADTNDAWKEAVNEIIDQVPNLSGIVLDVRNNPGGYLDSAVVIGSEFVSNGNVVVEDFSDGTQNPSKALSGGKFTNKKVPVAVLINGGSASAAEIVAGALKESRDAVLVGERSFGKGTVQKSEEYDDGAALHISIAKWLTPNGNWVNKHNATLNDSVYNERIDGEDVIGGLKPDYEVEITEDDVKNKKDPQLDKAIEIVKTGFKN